MTDATEPQTQSQAGKQPSESWEQFRDRAPNESQYVQRDIMRHRVMRGHSPMGPIFPQASASAIDNSIADSKQRLLDSGRWTLIDPTGS